MNKLQTSCSTLAASGMKVISNNKAVSETRKAVLEFLLVNHPLDCTICDQSGECDLQDFAYEYGSGASIVDHQKRVYGERNIGTFLQLERNRCIHCTRCVRYTEEITGTHEFGAFGRGHQLSIDTFFDHKITGPLQGNLADICPVGAITTKDFRFKRRVWKLKEVNSICSHCATGCNVKLQFDNKQLHRIKPRQNMNVNKWWMCDHGRVAFHEYTGSNALTLYSNNGEKIDLKNALRFFKDYLANAKQVIFINSGHSTLEELNAALNFFESQQKKLTLLKTAELNKNPPQARWILNLISADKAPNNNGLKQFKFNSVFKTKSLDPAALIIVVGPISSELTELINNKLAANNLIHISFIKNVNLKNINLEIPILSCYEKTGTIVNKDLIKQQLRALPFKLFPRISEQQLWDNLAAEIGISNLQSALNTEKIST